MKVQQVFPDLGRVVDLDLLDDKMNRYEKNWSPITISSDGEHVLLSRFVNPHQV